MSSKCTEALVWGLSLMLLSFLSTQADAGSRRNYAYNGSLHHGQNLSGPKEDSLEQSARSDVLRPRPTRLSGLMAELIRDCNRQLIELRNLPIEWVVQTIEPDAQQIHALGDIARIAKATADALVANCPTQAPLAPPMSLAAVERGIDAVETATARLRQPLETFDELLRDEQRHRLSTGLWAVDPDAIGAAELSKSLRHVGSDQERRAGGRGWDCRQWLTELRAWPISEFEQTLHLTARQRGAFYQMAASFQFAADSLEDSCPLEPLPTPIGRLLNMTERLEALHQSAAIIRAPLQRFYEVLDWSQRDRFGADM